MLVFRLLAFVLRQLLIGVSLFGLFLPFGACQAYLSDQIAAAS